MSCRGVVTTVCSFVRELFIHQKSCPFIHSNKVTTTSENLMSRRGVVTTVCSFIRRVVRSFIRRVCSFIRRVCSFIRRVCSFIRRVVHPFKRVVHPFKRVVRSFKRCFYNVREFDESSRSRHHCVFIHSKELSVHQKSCPFIRRVVRSSEELSVHQKSCPFIQKMFLQRPRI
jgi:hypothetical protein